MSSKDTTGTPKRANRRQSLSLESEGVAPTPEKSSMQVKRHMDLQQDDTTLLTPTRRSSRVVNSPALKKSATLITALNSDNNASPMRRQTRSMSQEKDLQPPLPSSFRVTRRSSIAESDEDNDNKKVNTVPSAKAKSSRSFTARKSVLLNETIKEEEVGEEEEKDLNHSTDNELELRNRSISKSPNMSSNSSAMSTNAENLAVEKLEETKVEIESFISNNSSFKSKRDFIEKQSMPSPKILMPATNQMKITNSCSMNKSLNEIKSKSPTKKKNSLPAAFCSSEDAVVALSPKKSPSGVLMSPSKNSKMSPKSNPQSWDKPFLNHSGSPIDNICKAVSPTKNFGETLKINDSIIKETNKLSGTIANVYDTDDSDDSRDSSKQNLFIDDMCEVKSNVDDEEDTMSEGERQYLAENEIVIQGEILGSDDTESEVDDEDEDAEDDDSFIHDENISDQYSMNSDEDAIEKEEISGKSKKRRVICDSSTDEDSDTNSTEKNKDENLKTSVKEPLSAEEDNTGNYHANENEEFNNGNLEKSLLKVETHSVVHNGLEDIVSLNSTNAESLETIINSEKNKANAKRKLNASGDDTEGESKLAKKRKIDESPNVDLVTTKKKLKLSNEPMKLSSSEDSTNESSEKTKIESVISTCTDYIEKFNEEKRKREALKRARKAEKLAKKKTEEPKDQSDSSTKENSTIKKKKKNKRKIKKPKTVEDAKQEKKEDIGIFAMKIMEKREQKLRAKIEKKKIKKKMNAQATASSEVTEKTNTKTLLPKDSETPGIKMKRKFSECSKNDTPSQVEKPTKKLKMISNIEQSKQNNVPMTLNGDNNQKDEIKLISASAKIRKIVQNPVKVEKSKAKKRQPLKIPENRQSLPRPVWSTSGMWIEEPTTPFKFSKVKYTPINCGTPESFSIASLQLKSKSNNSVAEMDFRTKSVLGKKAGRDGSIKNIKALMKSKSSQKF